jgi:hypothetical protein
MRWAKVAVCRKVTVTNGCLDGRQRHGKLVVYSFLARVGDLALALGGTDSDTGINHLCLEVVVGVLAHFIQECENSVATTAHNMFWPRRLTAACLSPCH